MNSQLPADSVAKFLPYGGYLTQPTATALDRGYTGHDRTAADDSLGLVYMNARYLDSQTGRFISADTLVPEPGNPQAFNRYAYVLGNPLGFSDPSGHCRYDSDGNFQYAEDCTVEEFAKLTWNDRIRWIEMFMRNNNAFWFYNVIGIIEYFRDDPIFGTSDWASYADAGVLAAIQDGWRAAEDLLPIGTGGAEWHRFFDMLRTGESFSRLLAQWGVAEQSGVDYGMRLARQFISAASPREQVHINTFVMWGNAYRTLLSNGLAGFPEETYSDIPRCLAECNSALPDPWMLQRFAFDPRSPSSRVFVREFSRSVINAYSADAWLKLLVDQATLP